MNEPQPSLPADRHLASFWAAAALVLVVFGLPLFARLGAIDFRGDEPIYSFAIDRMLDVGDWLTPRSIPDERTVWFEKPPLKFWIVAGSIRLGLLPHDEFGMRFWDATFGVAAFLYVLAIGYRMSGVLCGLTAVLVLFTHRPLLLEHGLRSNNMEAGLFLAYCAGIYHAMTWADAETSGRRWRHAIAVALWFAFGFMLKFIAAIFLPAVIAATAAFSKRWRKRLREDWLIWSTAAVVVLAVVAPWFLYQTRAHGREFWAVIFGQHVFVRFTAYLDPQHLKPWYYYVAQMAQEISWSNDILLVSAGLVLLVHRAVVRRSDSAILLLVWFALPLAAISSGTSKLYHYVYPFLPPLALGAGLVVPTVIQWAQRRRGQFAAVLVRIWPKERSDRLPAAVRWILTSVAILALVLALITPVIGGVWLRAGGVTLLRSTTVTRPIVVALVLLVVLGRLQAAPLALVCGLLVLALPFDAYRNVRFLEDRQALADAAPMRSLRECLVRLHQTGLPRGIYLHTATPIQWRYSYYLRDAGWNEEESSDDRRLQDRLLGPGPLTPTLTTNADFAALRKQFAHSPHAREDLAKIDGTRRLIFDDDVVVLLPDGFSPCSGITGAGTHAAGGQ